MTLRQIPADCLPSIADDMGLTEAQVHERRGRFGFNDIVTAPPSNWLTLVADTARDPMVWFLLGMSLLFVIVRDYTEAAVLGAALAPLVLMDAYLHRRTQASTKALAGRLAAQVMVIRDGSRRALPARELVPGDLVDIPPGSPAPADGLIVGGDGVQFDESVLTGEAWPVRKQPLDLAGPPPRSADSAHWGLAGTRLLTGGARMRVAFTGDETLYGEIVRSAVIGAHAHTPLQKAISRLVTLMLGASLALCLALAVIRLLQGHGLFDAFLSAATLAIAALPEEFPVVFTFFLGVGVYRLARRQVLVRRSVAVENIGRVTCICSDKTGTLTEGVLTLAHLWSAPEVSEETLLRHAAAASRRESGDPLDAAVLAAAPVLGWARRAAFPFTEDRRRETAILITPDGGTLAVTKGAPETVFKLCVASEADLAGWRQQVENYAELGHKVIAVASLAIPDVHPITEEPGGGYTLSGLLALEDPIRRSVPGAVAACRTAGIRVLMVTGDHPATAEAIARELGLGSGGPKVVLAESIDFDLSTQGADALRGVDVVARAAPGQKLRLVQALQRSGEVVAVTGDGVNDVPALQTADVGVAMGERGTQSAREVAAIVLLDDNFRTIVGAIAEGRQLFGNLQLSFAYILMIHIPLVLTAAAIPLAGHPLLYLPIHIVWLELIIHPTALLVFQDRPTKGSLPALGVGGSAHFFKARSWVAILASGLVLAVLIYFGFERALGAASDTAHARALAFACLVAISAASTAALSGMRGRTSWVMVGGSLTILVLIVQAPPLARLVDMAPLHLHDWALVAAAAAVAGGLSLLAKASLPGRPLDGGSQIAVAG